MMFCIACVKKICSSLFLVLILASFSVYAGPREQAKRIHDRIAGVPPDEATLAAMESAIVGNNALGAAQMALDHPAFYDVTLKNLITPWTNEAQTVFAPLNDYTATAVGVVRDELDFRTILYDDILYVANDSLGLPDYSNFNNDHYEALENEGYSLKDNLVRKNQSVVTGLATEATAGVVTSRASAKAFFIDGTNRAMFRFTMLNHLCTDLEQIKDPTRSPDRVRQDVSRSPGGDSRIYMNACVGCHAGMDPLAQAYAYYDYEYDADADPDGINGSLVFNSVGFVDPDTGTRVQGKYLINANNFKYGFVTKDDRWDNYWRNGPNSLLKWDTLGEGLLGAGNGAKSLGVELAHSEAFANCQVEKVFENVCFRPPVDGADRTQVANMVSSFKSNNFNLKQVFAESAVYCMGD